MLSLIALIPLGWVIGWLREMVHIPFLLVPVLSAAVAAIVFLAVWGDVVKTDDEAEN